MSLRKDLGYNLVLTVSNYIFPLVTFPYISRVLGVNQLGVCNYIDSIIQYFILFSTLGVVSFGVREIARCNNDFEKCSKIFSNLFAINLLLTILASLVLIIITFSFPFFAPYQPFLLIGLFKLIANLFLTEWFFQGIQQFKYITIRSIIVRLFYILSLFCFVHQPEDSKIYYFLTVATVVFNAIMNWNYSKKFRKLDFKGLTLLPFFVPILIFGYYRVLTSMYTTFNVIFLGSVSGESEVGCFTTATKLYTIIMSVFTAITTVLVPRVSKLLHNGQLDEVQRMANNVFSTLTILSLPIIIFSQFYAGDIIYLLSGPGYENAIIPFRIVIFMLLVIGFEQIAIQQFLMATTSTKSIMIVSTVGAVVGVSINLYLTPRLGSNGAALAWGVSELSVLLVGLFLVKKITGVFLDIKELIVNLLMGILYFFPLVFSYYFFEGVVSFIIGCISTIVMFLFINLCLHPNMILLNYIRKKI